MQQNKNRIAVVVTIALFGLLPGAALAESVVCPRPDRIFVGKDGGPKLPLGSNMLVDNLYMELAAKAVVERGKCTCKLWVPSWQAAVDVFYRDYAGISGEALINAQNASRKRAAPLLIKARKLCRQAGLR